LCGSFVFSVSPVAFPYTLDQLPIGLSLGPNKKSLFDISHAYGETRGKTIELPEKPREIKNQTVIVYLVGNHRFVDADNGLSYNGKPQPNHRQTSMPSVDSCPRFLPKEDSTFFRKYEIDWTHCFAFIA